MTKTEAIRNTEYTEDELINIALMVAKLQAKEWRDMSEDSESWDHHEALMNAFEAILEERKTNK